MSLDQVQKKKYFRKNPFVFLFRSVQNESKCFFIELQQTFHKPVLCPNKSRNDILQSWKLIQMK